MQYNKWCAGITAAQATVSGAGKVQAAVTGRQTEEDPAAARAAAKTRRCKYTLIYQITLVRMVLKMKK